MTALGRSRSCFLVCAAAAVAASACREASDLRPSLVTHAEILALEAEPPEAAPGEPVSYHALVVDGHGTLAAPELAFSHCRTREALGDNRVASDACAEEDEAPFDSQGPDAEADLPDDACALFGPSVPAGERAPDPDTTGGYYQPVRVALRDEAAVGLERIACPLPDAPIAIAQAFRARYRANRNPMLVELKASHAGSPVALDRIPRGLELTLGLAWPEESAERFVVYDKTAARLVTQREAMRVSWFVTAGELAYDHTGRAAEDTALTSANRWRAPDRASTARLWVVLRDSRGGTTHESYELRVP